MSTLKKWLLIIIVLIALVQTGAGGLVDMLQYGTITSQHGWTDGMILMLLAIVVAIAVK
jgi:phosphotransferase system  glucose/maltose/N-acetylglucosamine-specific IIC component